MARKKSFEALPIGPAGRLSEPVRPPINGPLAVPAKVCARAPQAVTGPGMTGRHWGVSGADEGGLLRSGGSASARPEAAVDAQVCDRRALPQGLLLGVTRGLAGAAMPGACGAPGSARSSRVLEKRAGRGRKAPHSHEDHTRITHEGHRGSRGSIARVGTGLVLQSVRGLAGTSGQGWKQHAAATFHHRLFRCHLPLVLRRQAPAGGGACRAQHARPRAPRVASFRAQPGHAS